jgi:glucokinase
MAVTACSGAAIGVDVGATTVKAAVVAPDGTIMGIAERWTSVTSSAAVEADIVAVLAELDQSDVVGVGLATPGWTSADRRTVVYSPNLPWHHEPLADRIEQVVGLPVVLENDANAAAWGEFRFGVAKGTSSMIAMTLGSGVGGAVVVNGALVRGHHGCAGEIGHCIQETNGRPCACGRIGCNENYASGRALMRRAAELIGVGRDLVAEAKAARSAALQVYEEFGTYVGRALTDPILLLNPDIVVIGGGVVAAFDLFAPAIGSALSEALGPNWRGIAPPIAAASLGADAGRVGVADLAGSHATASAPTHAHRVASS